MYKYKVEEQMVPSKFANGKFVARPGYTPLYLDNFVVSLAGTQKQFDSIIQAETCTSTLASPQLPTYTPTQNTQYYSAYQHPPSSMDNENNGNSARLSPSGYFYCQQMMGTVPSPVVPFESVCSRQSFYVPSPSPPYDCYHPAYSPGNMKAASNGDNMMENNMCGSNRSNNNANSTNTNTNSVSVLNEMDRSKMTLRACLADASYQTKFNLKSVDFPVINGTHDVATGQMKSEANNLPANRAWPINDLMSQTTPATRDDNLLQNEMQTFCDNTRISPDPNKWSVLDAHKWICHNISNIVLRFATSRDFNTISQHCNDHFGHLDGPALSSFTEKDFKKRDNLFGLELARLFESWKSGYVRFYQFNDLLVLGTPESSNNTCQKFQNGSEEKKLMPSEQCTHDSSSSPRFSSPSSSVVNTSSSILLLSTLPVSKSGARIHLWQFLRELLDQDHQHGSCIQWIDRKQGIFRVVDSVRVGKLWGTRKNRPAMNYDKLSRSIRQYYKKGIMKKTEMSQRLVYQFCPAFIH